MSTAHHLPSWLPYSFTEVKHFCALLPVYHRESMGDI
jgi:hypothetical protein